MRQHFALDLPPQLEFTPDAFLLHGRLFVALDVGRHLVESACELTDFVRRSHRDARVVIALRDAANAFAECAEVPRQMRGERHDPDQCDSDEEQPEPGVSRRGPAQVGERVTDRARDTEAQAGSGLVLGRDDNPVALAHDRRTARLGDIAEPGDANLVGLGTRVDGAVPGDGEGYLATIPLGGREHQAENVRQIQFGIHRAHDLSVSLDVNRDVIAGE